MSFLVQHQKHVDTTLIMLHVMYMIYLKVLFCTHTYLISCCKIDFVFTVFLQVDEVRTADDALIRVKLMIFYELTDIELMV